MMILTSGSLPRRALASIAREMKDRFGPAPESARLLLDLASLKIACAEAGFSRVDAKNGKAVFRDASTLAIRSVKELKGKTPRRKIAELLEFAKRASGE